MTEAEFAAGHPMDQLHIRMKTEDARAVRDAAKAAQEELGAYVREAIRRRMAESAAAQTSGKVPECG